MDHLNHLALYASPFEDHSLVGSPTCLLDVRPNTENLLQGYWFSSGHSGNSFVATDLQFNDDSRLLVELLMVNLENEYSNKATIYKMAGVK